MSGIGVVVFVIIFLVSLANRKNRRPGRSDRIVAVLFWKLALLAIMAAVALATAPIGLVLLLPMALCAVRALVLVWIVVPLGLPRIAYWVARCCWTVEVMWETAAGAAMYGALALARKSPSADTIDWLENKVKSGHPLRGAAVLTLGLLAAQRGDRRGARGLLLVVDASERNFVSSRGRAIARDWLIADAARIGNWREVIRLGRPGYGYDNASLRWSYCMARIAERLIGDPRGARDWQLWLIWLLAPRRWATLSFLRRALAVPRAIKPPEVAPFVAESLPQALRHFADALPSPCAQGGAVLAAAVGAVDAMLDDPATRTAIAERARAIGAQNDPDAVVASVRTRLVDFLAPLFEQAPGLAGASLGTPTLEQAIERTRMRLFRDVEAQCKDYDARRNKQDFATASGEWEAWGDDARCRRSPARARARRGTHAVPDHVLADVQFRGLSAQSVQAHHPRLRDLFLALSPRAARSRRHPAAGVEHEGEQRLPLSPAISTTIRRFLLTAIGKSFICFCSLAHEGRF
jgi:hypothetical protein